MILQEKKDLLLLFICGTESLYGGLFDDNSAYLKLSNLTFL